MGLYLVLFLLLPSIITACIRSNDCGENRSGCCGEWNQWKTDTKRAFEQKIHDKANLLRSHLSSSINSLRTHLTSSIFRSHRHMDSLFSQTYGTFYESNTKVFSDLFSDLQMASIEEDIRVEEVVTPFYRRLFRIVFMLSNPTMRVNVEEAECMGQSMDELNPFGDIPKRTKVHLERTIHGWRELLISLQTTHNILQPFSNTSLTSSCVSSLTQMSICPSCSSTPLQVCRPLCISTLSSCLSEWNEMDEQWNVLIGWLSRLSIRLKEAYSLSSTLDSLPAMMSEAIMTYQDRSTQVTNKVVAKCIMTDIKMKEVMREERRRERRSMNTKRISLRQIALETETHHRASMRLIDNLFEKLSSMKSFFSSLPRQICAMETVSASSDEKCWNNDGKTLQVKQNEEVKETVNASPFRGTFVNEGVRFGLLSFRIATFIYGKNYTGYILEGSGNPTDDEDYWESSGDVSIMQLERAPQPDIKVYPPSSPSSFSSSQFYSISLFISFLIVLL